MEIPKLSEIVDGSTARVRQRFFVDDISQLLPSENKVSFDQKERKPVFGYDPKLEEYGFEAMISKEEFDRKGNFVSGSCHGYETRGIEAMVSTSKNREGEYVAGLNMTFWVDDDNGKYVSGLGERIRKAAELVKSKKSSIRSSWRDADKALNEEKKAAARAEYPITLCGGYDIIKNVKAKVGADSEDAAGELAKQLCGIVQKRYAANLSYDVVKAQVERSLQLGNPEYRASQIKA